jgi:hypothetical protein
LHLLVSNARRGRGHHSGKFVGAQSVGHGTTK